MKKPIYGQPVIGIENKENDEELTITEMNNKSEIKCECELCGEINYLYEYNFERGLCNIFVCKPCINGGTLHENQTKALKNKENDEQ